MDSTEKMLRTKFRLDVNNIASTFVQLFQLCHKQEISNLSDPLLRWLDFRLRFIDPRPRKLLFSKKFPKLLPKNIDRAAKNLFRKIEAGIDINPYQGKGLILHHDTSGNKREHRTDLLWADWNIVHFHLCDKEIPKNRYFSERSDWLLFGMVGYDFLVCIDIRHHKDNNLFNDPELVKIVAQSWPQIMSQYELKGVHGLEADLTAEEYAKVRKGGVACPVAIDGKVYIGPGMGVTTASTATRVTSAEIDVLRYVDFLAKAICDPSTQCLPGYQKTSGHEQILSLCITPNGLAIHDDSLNMAWVLPKMDNTSEPDYLYILHNLLAPEWCVKKAFPEP
ncbi:MAG: hypothetical protein FD174_3981 [Geobacteraceae bacterium]|nr:MAG: hypothetical protein FD174_3981 [Geobacteraceae bacterium]